MLSRSMFWPSASVMVLAVAIRLEKPPTASELTMKIMAMVMPMVMKPTCIILAAATEAKPPTMV